MYLFPRDVSSFGEKEDVVNRFLFIYIDPFSLLLFSAPRIKQEEKYKKKGRKCQKRGETNMIVKHKEKILQM